MVNNPSEEPWICSVCQTHVDQVPSSVPSYLSCICFNARSIVAKRFSYFKRVL